MDTQDNDGVIKEDLTINPLKVQLQAMLFFVPFIVFFGLPYFFLWREKFTHAALMNLFSDGFAGIGIILIVFVLGVIVHELIHGITWSLFAKSGFKSIRFGVLWKSATPYCHCNEPLQIKHYLIGGLMPGLLMGIMPLIISLISGSLGWFLFGLFFTLAASGDFIIAKLLLGQDLRLLVQDHPSEVGCILYKPKIKEL